VLSDMIESQVSIHSSPPILYRITNPSQAKGDAKHEEGEAKKDFRSGCRPTPWLSRQSGPRIPCRAWGRLEQRLRCGAEQNAAGKEQEAKGQLKDWGEGIQNRAQGTLGSIRLPTDSLAEPTVWSQDPVSRLGSSRATAPVFGHEEGEAKKEASHTTSKLGPFTADPNTGAVARDDPKPQSLS
jgi:hypothetical protein